MIDRLKLGASDLKESKKFNATSIIEIKSFQPCKLKETMKIPFKVSSRTARLIGRENVSSAKGAVIELVKNGYDADSPFTLIYIDNKLSFFRSTLSISEYNCLLLKGISKDLLDSIYEKEEDVYVVKEGAESSLLSLLSDNLRRLASLYVIDCGEGMTEKILKDNWMTIGTDNKSTNYCTRKGRIKAGAKGIGRFAMDKLGANCEMITFFNPKVHDLSDDTLVAEGYRWTVSWNEFEGTNKTIDNVTAELDEIKGISFLDCLEAFELPTEIKLILRQEAARHGTALKITDLRDVWNDEAVESLFEDLAVLVPPAEQNDYSIILRTSSQPEKYGLIQEGICDDFDYKIHAIADSNQIVSIKIIRNENLVEKFPLSFFNRPNQKKQNYTEQDFKRGYWETKKTFSQLLPGYKKTDYTDELSQIGPFVFVFYFLKRSATKIDEKRFFYRHCSYSRRADWLRKFGGIKLFRDGFRVRPYGERNSSSFDWLGLGGRKQRSPAGITKKDGGYKVEVENVAGSICISRLTNVAFEDKSSREGLQENNSFQIFKKLIEGIISVFEVDRALIARELAADYDERNGGFRLFQKAEKLSKEILENPSFAKFRDGDFVGKEEKARHSIALLAALNEKKTQEIENYKEEQKTLRGLTSTGLMLASFSHDLTKIYNSLTDRYDKIKKNLLPYAKEEFYRGRELHKNPFHWMEIAHEVDKKMQNWLRFSTQIARKDRRRQKDITISTYMNNLLEIWETIFAERAIDIKCNVAEGTRVRAFEIELDSIFYNLFSNSIEAFYLMKADRQRQIKISWWKDSEKLICEYEDNGPGLCEDISEPEDIFEPLFTTKRNPTTGEEIGTGLGMWIIKLIAEDNNIEVELLKMDYGFGIRFTFPKKSFWGSQK